MPAADVDLENDQRLPFPPITRAHILNCSFHSWYPKYRSFTPKCRLIPLPPAFVDYLRADGIILPPDEPSTTPAEPNEDSLFNSSSSSSSSDDDEDDEEEDDADSDPSQAWPETHAAIARTIKELGGAVAPKLNWSAPKDATWISATNSMECTTPNEIYLLLKSSNFITHDLEHAFDGCVAPPISSTTTTPEISYHLVLRKHFSMLPSSEFRLFARSRSLLAICQRDQNHYDFLEPMVPTLRALLHDFYNERLRDSFEDDSAVFDVYVTGLKGVEGDEGSPKVWLVDVNPWAERTDPLLFSWMELLEMEGPGDGEGASGSEGGSKDAGESEDDEAEEETQLEAGVVRLRIKPRSTSADIPTIHAPTFRLIRSTDPEAYAFNSPQYSAHKLPKDVVDAASQGGTGPQRELLEQWQEVLARMRKEDERLDREEEEEGEDGN